MGQVATPVSVSSRMKLAQPFVLQKRWLWLVRRMRRAELARAANAAGARIVRVDIMVRMTSLALPGVVGKRTE